MIARHPKPAGSFAASKRRKSSAGRFGNSCSHNAQRNDPDSRSEKLGAAVLADDDEAVAFAQRVMRELIHSDEQLPSARPPAETRSPASVGDTQRRLVLNARRGLQKARHLLGA
jgi:hypothetical protein